MCMEYASEAWDPHLVKDIKKVEAVQRSAARFVKNNCNYTRENGAGDRLTQ